MIHICSSMAGMELAAGNLRDVSIGKNAPRSIMKQNSLTFGSKASARHGRRTNLQAHQRRAPL
jgi:hypothetical protein